MTSILEEKSFEEIWDMLGEEDSDDRE